jgi:hypothetical protein
VYTKRWILSKGLPITEKQFDAILAFIRNYDFRNYALTQNQCTSFASQVAEIGGLMLEGELTMQLQSTLDMGHYQLCLWSEPRYREITISSPDNLERSLIKAVRAGRATCALAWYLQNHAQTDWSTNMQQAFHTFVRFPSRYFKWLHISAMPEQTKQVPPR